MYNSLSFILGHFVGDYMLQTHNEALGKSKKGSLGRYLCFQHCFKYSVVVALFVAVADGWMFNVNSTIWWNFLSAFIIAFLSHFFIDRYSFGFTWMRWIKQTKFEDTFTECKVALPLPGRTTYIQIDNLRAFFIPIVYVACDNTMHLVLMWFAYSWIGIY